MKYTVRAEGRSFDVEIEDLRKYPIVVSVNGYLIEVWPEKTNHEAIGKFNRKKTDEKLPENCSEGQPQKTSNILENNNFKLITAPIPGAVISILVKPGDAVIKGQELCIIEAMKMRNTIRSSWAGVVEEILISPGQTVNHGAELIKFSS